MTDRKQFVSINGFNSNISTITSRNNTFPYIHINDFNLAIKSCKVHHFADDTNLLNINKSPKHLKKFINIDLKILQNGSMPTKYL